jgi:hypothetical protein
MGGLGRETTDEFANHAIAESSWRATERKIVRRQARNAS